MRRVSCWKSIRSSRRASDAPRQKCVPNPNATCGFGLRRMSNVYGSSNTASSRFADGYSRITRSPACTSVSAISRVARRGAEEVVERRHPADQLLDRAGDRARDRRPSLPTARGDASARSSPRATTVRVVSAPPEMNRPVSCTMTDCSIGHPPSSALAQTEIRSSCGAARRSVGEGREQARELHDRSAHVHQQRFVIEDAVDAHQPFGPGPHLRPVLLRRSR